MQRLLMVFVVLLAACGRSAFVSTPATAPLVSSAPTNAATSDPYSRLRTEMVTIQIEARDVRDRDILDAMKTVPRHLFVPADLVNQAYEDHPLPIGYGQTISQPYVVALMTEKLGVQRGDKVLEIGTGSGYQAAVLAQLGVEIYSVEIVPELARAADERLKQLGYPVAVRQGDGYFGWEVHAPYDAIIVTAAPDHVPQPLVRQLRDGGRLVIPIGPRGSFQTLWQFIRHGNDLKATDLGGVAFVPLVGGQ
jgi:protein-L-isoaspartate(D-aspartate) O-methyltransferase